MDTPLTLTQDEITYFKTFYANHAEKSWYFRRQDDHQHHWHYTLKRTLAALARTGVYGHVGNLHGTRELYVSDNPAYNDIPGLSNEGAYFIQETPKPVRLDREPDVYPVEDTNEFMRLPDTVHVMQMDDWVKEIFTPEEEQVRDRLTALLARVKLPNLGALTSPDNPWFYHSEGYEVQKRYFRTLDAALIASRLAVQTCVFGHTGMYITASLIRGKNKTA